MDHPQHSLQQHHCYLHVAPSSCYFADIHAVVDQIAVKTEIDVSKIRSSIVLKTLLSAKKEQPENDEPVCQFGFLKIFSINVFFCCFY